MESHSYRREDLILVLLTSSPPQHLLGDMIVLKTVRYTRFRGILAISTQ